MLSVRFRSTTFAVSLAAFWHLAAVPCSAVPLPVGNTVPVTGTTVAARPELAGPIIHDVVRPFQIRSEGGALLFSGELQNRVTRTVDGTLTFQYRIRNTQAGVPGALNLVVTQLFEAFSTDVDYRLDSLGTIGPAQATRTADAKQVGFTFTSAVVIGGTESRFIFIRTNSTAFDPTAGMTMLRLTTGESVSLPTAMPIRECNGNGVRDSLDIANGTSEDTNQSGVPDECENLTPATDEALAALSPDYS